VKGPHYDIVVTPSVLDRLIDLDPKSQRDSAPTRTDSVRELRRSVARDLDDLLNSRNSFPDLPDEFTEARRSVLTFGLPDFGAMNVVSPADRARLRQVLETTICTFESRLTNVTVTLAESGVTERSLRLHVDAQLVMEPAPEPVRFDVVVPVDVRKYEIEDRE
jgi:type VI secretion system protein ImpF